MWVKKRKYKLTGKSSSYRIILCTDPTKRVGTDVQKSLSAEIFGQFIKLTSAANLQTSGTCLNFSIIKHKSSASKLQWRLEFHKLRCHWSEMRDWKKSAILKLSVADDCYINIEIVYEKKRRAKTKRIYEERKRMKRVRARRDISVLILHARHA